MTEKEWRKRHQPSTSEVDVALETEGPRSTAQTLLDLQARAGNRSALAFAQTKLKVGAADDSCEREADTIADAIVDGRSTPPISMSPPDVQRRPTDEVDVAGPEGGEVDGDTTADLKAAASLGAALPNPVRAWLEPSIGDLSHVRVHTDARAADLNDRLGARAFTLGTDIFFNRGEYQPSSREGLRTIVHEATHVVQQGGHDHASVQRLHNPFRKLGKKINKGLGLTNVVGSGDVKKHTKGEGGQSANRVDKVELKKHAIKNQKKGFFKPQTEDTQSQNAVVSSRYARGLGMKDMIAQNEFGKIGGETGAFSGMAKGNQLRTSEFNKPANVEGMSENDIRGMVANGMRMIKKDDGQWYKKSANVYEDVDLSRPETQKGLNDLQWFDALTGQVDRHSANVFIDPETGGVQGIDDDLSFGKGVGLEDIEKGTDKNRGLPTMIDENTAGKIMAIKPSDLPKMLVRPGDPHKLTKKELDDAKKRLKIVQQHIESLVTGNGGEGIIYQWNKGTYDETVNSEGKSYTKAWAGELESARKGEFENRLKGMPEGPGYVGPLDRKLRDDMPPPVPKEDLKEVPLKNPEEGAMVLEKVGFFLDLDEFPETGFSLK